MLIVYSVYCSTFIICTDNLLDQSKFQWFWISWANNTISVGTDDAVGLNAFMSVPYPGFNINYIAVYNGYGSSGQWIFHLGWLLYCISSLLQFIKCARIVQLK